MNIGVQIESGITQADAAYAVLHGEIMSCKLVPGSKITISDVALRLGLSPGAVREALSRLTAERMTVAAAQRGFSVADVSADELKDLTRTRITIEQLCLRAAIGHGEVEWETAAVAAYHRLHRIPVVLDDPARLNSAWAAAHTTFHGALAAGCDSAWLLTLREILYAQSERYRYLSVALARKPRDIDAEHKAILDACLAHDAEAACRLIEEHLTQTLDILLDSPLLRARSNNEKPAGKQ
jgi:GntR family carbon starvation induced transcriptional regulator